MKVESKQNDNHQAVLTVELGLQELESAMRRVARQQAKNTKIPGFRPGKAPYNIILKRLGEEEITAAAIDSLIDDYYPKSVEEAGIAPYGPGQLTNIVSQNPPIFEFTVPLEPVVQLGDYKGIQKEFNPPVVSEEQVEDALKDILNSRATLKSTDAPAANGDTVYLEIKGTDGDGEVVFDHSYLPITVEGDDDNYPYPGFSTNFLGAAKETAGEFDAEIGDAEEILDKLRGKTVHFEYTVKEVKNREIPELNDEFAQSLGDFDSLDAVKEEIRNELEEHSSSDYKNQFESELVDEIIEITSITFPPEMVEDELDSMVRQLKNQLSNQNLDFDTYLKIKQQTEADVREEMRDNAIVRIKRGLTLMEIAKDADIKVDEDAIQSEITSYLNAVSAGMSTKDRKRLITQSTVSNMLNSALSDALMQNTLAYLKKLATGEEDEEEAEDETVDVNTNDEQDSVDPETESSEDEIIE